MDDTRLDLGGVLALLRRRARLIAVTTVAAIAVAAIIVFALTPIYAASALVLVDPSRKNLLEPLPQAPTTTGDSPRIDSEVEILRSDTVLLKVIEAQNLVADPELGVSLSWRIRLIAMLNLAPATLPTGAEALGEVIANLRDHVTIQRRGLTYVIAVQARSRSPTQAAQLANAIARTYIDDQVATKIASTRASRDILEARIVAARTVITSAETAFDAFIAANIARISRETGQPDLVATSARLAVLTNARVRNAATIGTVENGLAAADWPTIVTALQSAALIELQDQRTALLAQPDAPHLVDASAGLAEIEQRLYATVTIDVAALQHAIATSLDTEAAQRRDLRLLVLGSQSLPADILTSLYDLQNAAELARTQYKALLARAAELEAEADLQIADARIVSPALPPQQPLFPNKPLILGFTAAAGLALGIVLALLYENVLGGFMTEAQLASVLKLRVATAVPRLKPPAGAASLADQMLIAPLSVFAESVRRLRTALDQSLRAAPQPVQDQGQGRVLMVTSTAPDEGKTTLALALARSYALSGRSVLLVDADLRKPSVHSHLSIAPAQGLLDYLHADNADNLAAIVSRDLQTTATFLLGARRSDLPTDQLLAGISFDRLIAAARSQFDLIILDTPPIGPAVDGLYLAPAADAIVFIARWANTSQVDAKQAIASLLAAKSPSAEILAVLNQRAESPASHRRKYGKYLAPAR